MSREVVNLAEAKKEILQDLFGQIRKLGLTEKLVVERLRKKVRVARRRGASWQEIGDALGITRQGAWERFKNDGD